MISLENMFKRLVSYLFHYQQSLGNFKNFCTTFCGWCTVVQRHLRVKPKLLYVRMNSGVVFWQQVNSTNHSALWLSMCSFPWIYPHTIRVILHGFFSHKIEFWLNALWMSKIVPTVKKWCLLMCRKLNFVNFKDIRSQVHFLQILWSHDPPNWTIVMCNVQSPVLNLGQKLIFLLNTLNFCFVVTWCM